MILYHKVLLKIPSWFVLNSFQTTPILKQSQDHFKCRLTTIILFVVEMKTLEEVYETFYFFYGCLYLCDNEAEQSIIYQRQ